MSSFSKLLGHGLVVASGLASVVSAGVLRSRVTEGVKVTYKEPQICETTPGVKSYSGYLTLPSTPYQPYPQNIFFWFFESRNDPEHDPVSIWLQGGPGSPSIDQALGENGPCIVQSDSNSTVLNPWSWNNYANILYIDQPTQAGFSYDVVTSGVLDTVGGDIYPGDSWTGPLNDTARAGNFSSQDPTTAASTTAVSSEALWEFLQVWMAEFEQYRRPKVSIWSQSYGGHYAPAIANLLQTRSKECSSKSIPIAVDTVGIISGFIDFRTQAPYFPSFANNNTYGIQSYDPAVAESAANNYTMPGGCRDQIDACLDLTPNGYRDQYGTNDTVTEACGGAFIWCWTNVYYAYDAVSERGSFDITHPHRDPFPAPYNYGFLTQDWVQEALGAKVNYTQNSNAVQNNYQISGDFVFDGFTDDLGALLEDGVRVTLLNGDRDFRWVAGEAVSLTIDYQDKDEFAAAGYAEIKTNDTYVGGFVRQYGSFSFSRIFQAGHDIPNYQPETAYQLFNRTLSGKDIATGTVNLDEIPDFATEGPASVFDVKNEAPPMPESFCYILSVPLTLWCSDEQIAALYNGSAVVENYVVVSPAATAS